MNKAQTSQGTEKLDNFRWIVKLFGKYSTRTLTQYDLVPVTVCKEIAELGQFAELIYSATPIDILLKYCSALTKPGYPLEHITVLSDCLSVHSIRGDSADLPVHIFFRPSIGQLVVSISGTASFQQALYTLHVAKSTHPASGGKVHSGFWKIYQGIKGQIIDGLKVGLEMHSQRANGAKVEIVLTGHSLGASLCYLLLLDLLADEFATGLPLSDIHRLRIIIFGAPRTGDRVLVDYFRSLVDSARGRYGQHFIQEYSVRGFNDGIPLVPPPQIGFSHFCREPFYAVGPRLYRIPEEENEYSLFRVKTDEGASSHQQVLFPNGGHNYYNERDLELFRRRTEYLVLAEPSRGGNWTNRYESLQDAKNQSQSVSRLQDGLSKLAQARTGLSLSPYGRG